MYIKQCFKSLIICLLSSFLIGELSKPISILEKSINKFNDQNISFICDLKLQSLSSQPIHFNFNFYSYALDSLEQYSYIKFNSPIDYKNIELWSYYGEQTLITKRMPINNQIIKVEENSENTDIVNFFNFIKIFKDIKNSDFSINETTFNDKDIYLIKTLNSTKNKKSVKFYIDKLDLSIYKIEWTNRRGALNKILSFHNWILINDKIFPSKVIYEDIKKGSKSTCELSKIELNKLDQSIIDLIMIGLFSDD